MGAIHTAHLARNGDTFGFTIAREMPCVLNTVEPGTAAADAGLLGGDAILAINGHDVTRTKHDDVVRVLGSSHGHLELRVWRQAGPLTTLLPESFEQPADPVHAVAKTGIGITDGTRGTSCGTHPRPLTQTGVDLHLVADGLDGFRRTGV